MNMAFRLYLTVTMLLIGLLANSQSVQFTLQDLPECTPCQVGLRGSHSPLSWERSLPLTATGSGSWSADITLAGSEAVVLEYKYVLEKPGDNPLWELEGQGNRVLLPGKQSSSDRWNKRAALDAATLPPISASYWQEDLAVLREAILTVHPGTFRYRSRAQVDSMLEATSRYFSQDRSRAEGFLALLRLSAYVQCGHTILNPLNQSTLMQELMYGQKDKLPFTLTVLGDQLVVLNNASEAPLLTPGAVVERIQGVSAVSIIKDIKSYASADGANDGMRLNRLGISGYARSYDLMDAVLPVLYPPVNGRYTLNVQSPAGAPSVALNVQALSSVQRDSVLAARDPDRWKTPEDSWTFAVLDQQAAYLQLGTFAIFNFSLDWRNFLEEAFRALNDKGIPNLIIDLRGNAGGADEVIQELGRYLLREDCETESFQPRMRYSVLPPLVRQHSNTWDTAVYRPERMLLPQATAEGYFLFKDDPEKVNYRKSRRAYQGQVYLMMDESCSSATFYLARLARNCNMANLVGTPTGGNQQGVNGGTILFLTLPRSGIEVDVPVFGNFSRKTAPNSGLVPDIPLTLTAGDLSRPGDAQLDMLLRQIAP